jgi:predicted dehydrogenase
MDAMPVRIGFLTAAHLHVWGYLAALRNHKEAELVGLWDHDAERGKAFASRAGIAVFGEIDELLGAVDAVVVASENKRHAPLIEAAAARGVHILCEKPLVTSEEEAARVVAAIGAGGSRLMTAFPCRFSPAFGRLKERVDSGEIGKIRAICATNRGRCPFGWFVEKEHSGGGAMIDHVVHVADLLRVLLGEDPVRVHAATGANIHGQEWEDTAMLTLEYASGIFATLDSSWSRPKSYHTWGDVTMNVVGDAGIIELDMFGPAVDLYADEGARHTSQGYGSDLDALLIDAFLRSILDGTPTPVSVEDGLLAARVALAGYRSAEAGEPVPLQA